MGVEAMVATTIASGVMQFAQGKQNADAYRAQARFNEQQNKYNIAMMEIRKKELNAQADEAIDQRYQDVARILGSQKVAAAAGNISLGSDVMAALEEDERTFAREDAAAIRANARKEAMGIEVKQMDLAMQTEMANRQASQQAQNSMVQGTIGLLQSGVTAYGLNARYGAGKSIPSSKGTSAYNYKGPNTGRIA